MNRHVGNALWLVSALPSWYMSTVAKPLEVGILSLIPFSGILALLLGVVIGFVQRRPMLLLFLSSLFVSECYVAVAGALRGQVRGSASLASACIFLIIQASLMWFLVRRLKGARLAASALTFFCASYAFFALFVGAMAFADDWL